MDNTSGIIQAALHIVETGQELRASGQSKTPPATTVIIALNALPEHLQDAMAGRFIQWLKEQEMLLKQKS